MNRPLMRGQKLVLASHNQGKLREITSLLSPYDMTVLSAAELGLSEPEETEDTFAGNARIKAHFAARETGLVALADDSGLCVDALGGEPGVYTADWAQTPDGRDFAMAMDKVWSLLQDTGARAPYTARFCCTLCLAWGDRQDAIFTGEAEGTLTWPPRGTQGFGFDPMFVPEGHARTFGEMPFIEKEPLTHRAAAWRKLTEAIFA